jgi:hypothetical protein
MRYPYMGLTTIELNETTIHPAWDYVHDGECVFVKLYLPGCIEVKLEADVLGGGEDGPERFSDWTLIIECDVRDSEFDDGRRVYYKGLSEAGLHEAAVWKAVTSPPEWFLAGHAPHVESVRCNWNLHGLGDGDLHRIDIDASTREVLWYQLRESNGKIVAPDRVERPVEPYFSGQTFEKDAANWRGYEIARVLEKLTMNEIAMLDGRELESAKRLRSIAVRPGDSPFSPRRYRALIEKID